MARYLVFDTNHFDFATRVDTTYRKEYFNDFVFSGVRDRRVYGLTKITPSMNVEYDVNGLKFLGYVLGATSGNTLLPSSGNPTYMNSISVEVDGERAGMGTTAVDTWELTSEEGNPVKAQFTGIGMSTTNPILTPYDANFCSAVVMPADLILKLGGVTTEYSRLQISVNNNVDVIFRNQIIPSSLRAQGLEVSGRIRVPNYMAGGISDNTMSVGNVTVGTIFLGTIKLTELPARATGFDLPETDYAFTIYPPCATGEYSMKAVMATAANTIW